VVSVTVVTVTVVTVTAVTVTVVTVGAIKQISHFYRRCQDILWAGNTFLHDMTSKHETCVGVCTETKT
jgi:hypothetical protein